jgi:hypothetical protein
MAVQGMSASPPAQLLKQSVQADMDQVQKNQSDFSSLNMTSQYEIQVLGDLVQQFRPDLILAVLPDPAEDQYRKIKRFGDVVQGIATQCVVRSCRFIYFFLG